MSMNKKIGERVKSFRESKNITTEELAERSGLNSEQILTVEENAGMPSLAPLIRISRALGVRLGTFLDDQEEIGPVVCRKEETKKGISFSNDNSASRKHMTYNSLSNIKSGRHMEPFMINVAPKSEVDFVLSSHEGEEFILVLEGCIEVNYADKVYVLEKGDSIYYDSIVPHIVRSCDENESKILAVIYTPI